MDFDAVQRENLALYPKFFEECPYIPQMDNEGLISSSLSHGSSSRVLNNLDHHFMVEGSLSNPFSVLCSPFDDPFDPFQASFEKLNQEFSSSAFAHAPNYVHMHGSQSRRFLDPYHQLDLQTMSNSSDAKDLEMDSCLVLNGGGGASDQKITNVAKHSKTKEPLQTKRKRIINKKSDIIKGQWTPEEDRLLMELVGKHGVRKWSTIAQMLPGRIGKQCRERWHNHLKPNIKKDRWTEEEDRILIEAHRQLGNKWAEIARSLPGRSENTIKNHWNATKRRQLSSRGKNNSSKSNTISPLQNYIKSVISGSDIEKGYLENSSSSGSAASSSPADVNILNPIVKSRSQVESFSNLNIPENDHQTFAAVDESFKLLDAQMHIQSDLQKEMDFMEMLSYGYI